MRKSVKKISMLHLIDDVKADYFMALTKMKAAVSLVFGGLTMSGVYSGRHAIVFEDTMLHQTYLHHMHRVNADGTGENAWEYFNENLKTDIEACEYKSALGTDDIVEQMSLYGVFDEKSVIKETSKAHMSIFSDLFNSIDSLFQLALSTREINYINITFDEHYNLVIEIKHM